MDGMVFVIFITFVCLSVTLDPNMCRPGICCTDYILHNNSCTECEAGTTGPNCSETCVDGYYGKRCRKKCSIDCTGICNKINGSCTGRFNVNTQSFDVSVTTNGTPQTDLHNIENFLKARLWIIAGVSSVLVILTCGCIGVFFFCKTCKYVGKKRRTLARHPNQDTQPSVRYESDRDMQDFSANITRPSRTNDNGSANGSANTHVPKTPNVENSKPKTKKRYSLVRKVTVSQEVTSCSNMSEEDDDVFDSDECDDYTNTCGGVQISELPSKQSSFNTFLSPYDNSQSGNDDNTEYGKLWR
ncbi:uncharacterized protein LOC125664481 isoform X2 [Ostrea edulis]|uniref:uncharacterized protein LOC125664481 isoform X2 n=1 Tax=Ostrea edulis TaxID=37623 RepID=UPI0024AEE450|nr:uncharacterized protein LOC125664481 isoform X2 [Ostrea edulis]